MQAEIYKKRTWTFRFDDSKGMMTYTNKSKKKKNTPYIV